MKIALAMICKGSKKELKKLSNCLKSAAPHVDGIFVYVNAKDITHIPKEDFERVAAKYSAVFDYGTWEGNFGTARRASFAMVSPDYEWILWLDADDVLVNGSEIREVAKKATSMSGIYANYEYDIDKFGNVLTEHAVARLVRNDGSFQWSNKLVHETLEPVRRVSSASTESFHVRHDNSEKDKESSLLRNIELLEQEIEGEGASPDARTLYYLGCHYIDADMGGKAQQLLERYLELSGWEEERAQAHIHLGRMAAEQGRNKEARQHFLWAVDEGYRSPAPYYELGVFYLNNGEYRKAIYWLEWCAVQKRQLNSIASNPLTATYFAYLGLAIANKELGGRNLEKALQWAEAALKVRKEKLSIDIRNEIKQILDMSKELEDFVRKFKKADADEKVTLLSKVPKKLKDNPIICELRNNTLPPVEWPDKSIVFYIGNSVIGKWGPWSLKEGVGGSEEAVIRISRQFKEMGWDVTIYGSPQEHAGDYDGVHWRNYWEFPKFDKFNALIVWRSPEFFDYDHNAKKAYLWMHDVDALEEFTEERLNRIDKVILLSKYHRSIFPVIPEDKVLLSANGIDPDEIAKYDEEPRNPHRVIYTSSHVRNLARLYEIWPEVLKAVPGATLDVYYGWHSYDKITGDNPERKAWKEEMIRLAETLPGVTDNGKVGQDRISQETASSGVWAYPTSFPEISCISAMKAQAGGAVPVVSNYAALDETVQHGIKMPLSDPWTNKEKKAYTKALIDMLLDTDKQEEIRKEMMPWARSFYSWRKVAEGWADDIDS